MRTLYLHIGPRWTGDMALRAAFGRSRLALMRAGIVYPRDLHARDASRAEAERLIARGFGTHLARWSLAQRLGSDLDALISSPLLFDWIADQGFAETLASFARRAGFERVSLLLAIRDPFDHLGIEYGEMIRAGTTHARISDFAETFDMPARTQVVLQEAARTQLDMTVVNLDHRNGDLLGAATAWLGLAADVLRAPDRAEPRPLTAAEAAFQRALVQRMDAASEIFLDELLAATPDLPPDLPRLPSADRTSLAARLSPAMEAVNARIGDAEHYRRPPATAADSPNSDEIRISREHLRALTGILVRKVRG